MTHFQPLTIKQKSPKSCPTPLGHSTFSDDCPSYVCPTLNINRYIGFLGGVGHTFRDVLGG